jgi:hypothetical protein
MASGRRLATNPAIRAILLTASLLMSGCDCHRGGGPAARALFAAGPRSVSFDKRAGLILIAAPPAFPGCWFLVDTGASWCALDTTAFPNLPSHPGGSDALDQPGRFVSDPPHVVLGPFDIGVYGQCAYVDLAEIGRCAGADVIGIIGSPAFEDGTLQIDYCNQTLRLLPSDDQPHPEWGSRRPLEDDHGRPFARFDLNGTRARVVIDTGLAGSVMATPELQAKLDPQSTLEKSDSPKIAISGWRTSPDMACPRFVIDGVVFKDLLVEGTSLPVSAVGNDYLGLFLVTLDYRNGWLYLRPEEREQFWPDQPARPAGGKPTPQAFRR